MWSGVETTGDKNIDSSEHIFPESIGGRDTLPVGDVSKEWNIELSKLDRVLRYGHPAMMLAYQKDSSIKGKTPKGKKEKRDKIRKRREDEKTLITGDNGKAIVKTEQETGNTTLTNVSFDFNDEFSRAIHKCVANVICNEYGSKYVRRNFPELLDFVKNGTNPHSWPYAVSFANPFQNLFCQPKCLKLGYFSVTGRKENLLTVIAFIHSSGIWMAAAKPHHVNKEIIEKFSEGILKDNTPLVQKVQNQGYDFRRLYSMNWVGAGVREYIGELKFLWVKKQIQGKPNPEDAFYLLTKCRLCGQINPTGFMVAKETALTQEPVPMVISVDSMLFDMEPQNMVSEANGKRMRFVRMPKNSWNRYTPTDLRAKGWDVEKWERESVQRYIDTQGSSEIALVTFSPVLAAMRLMSLDARYMRSCS